jgi:transcriptional regulator with XRE-family HTH domain
MQIIICSVVRTPRTEAERAKGRALGRAIRAARGTRSPGDVADRAGISRDTLRKIELGTITAPAFFTVVALAQALDTDVATLAAVDATP